MTDEKLRDQLKALLGVVEQQAGQIAALQFALTRVIETLPHSEQGAVSVNVDLHGALAFKGKNGEARTAFVSMRDKLIPKAFPRSDY